MTVAHDIIRWRCTGGRLPACSAERAAQRAWGLTKADKKVEKESCRSLVQARRPLTCKVAPSP